MTVPIDETSPPAPRGRPRRWPLVLFGLALPLFLLELVVRLYGRPVDLMQVTGRVIGANPAKQWGLVDAYAALRGRPGMAGAGKTINSGGFISTPETPVRKPAGTLRIVFLGESSTAGQGVDLPDELTWPWQVVERLRRRFPERRFDFLNAALGGYTTFESYGRLWSRVRFYEPDVVVVYHGWNELYYFSRAGDERILTWRTLADGDWNLDHTTRPIRWLEPLLIDHLLQWSQLAVHARLHLARWTGASRDGEVGSTRGELSREWNRAGLDVFRMNLRLIESTTDLMGAELFVGKQATLIVPDLPPEQRARCQYERHNFDHDAHVEAFAALYDVIDEEIDPERIVDLTGLSGRPELFADHVHPTPEGAAAIADLFAEALAKWVAGH